MTKPTNQEIMLNNPFVIKGLSGKEFLIKDTSLGVNQLIQNKFFELMDLMNVKPEELKSKDITGMGMLLFEILNKALYSENKGDFLLKLCEMVALAINNKQPGKYTSEDITAEEVLFEFSQKEIEKLLFKWIERNDVVNFLQPLTRLLLENTEIATVIEKAKSHS